MNKHWIKLKTLFAIAAVIVTVALLSAEKQNDPVAQVNAYYRTQVDSLQGQVKLLREMLTTRVPQAQVQQAFLQARLIYKRIESLVEYHFPETALKINGPNLLEAETSEPEQPIYPTGFQVLEEVVFASDNWEPKAAIKEVDGLIFAVNRLKAQQSNMSLTRSSVLDALKLNLYRLITRGISGFDVPVALNSIPEATSTMRATVQLLNMFPEADQMHQSAQKTLQYLEQYTGDFNEFDRAVFVSKYVNPLCVSIYQYQVDHAIPFVQTHNRAIAANAPHLFSEEAYDLSFYTPTGAPRPTAAIIDLGRQLFNDNRLSATGKRSCATCHMADKAFTDGLALNETIAGDRKLLRNTPTLLNVAYQPVQFLDSRVTFLEDQVHDVIANPAEMGGAFDHIVAAYTKDKVFRKSYQQAYRSNTITAANIKYALAAYVRSLTAMNSPFDRYMRGDEQAMTAQEISGFNIFMGKAKCGTCHFMPAFNGSVPPYFEKMESEVLGIPQTPDTLHAKLDLDSGKYHLYKIPHQLHSFKTTSVRNAAVTAPYMHNGVFTTLREVIDFYNRGGGAGLGFELDNQTLPPDPLGLTEREKKDLEAFIGALTDTTSYKQKIIRL